MASSSKPSETDPKATDPKAADSKPEPSPRAAAPPANPQPTGPETRVQETATESKRAGYDVNDLRTYRDDPSPENHERAAALLRRTGPLAVDGDVFSLDGAGRVQGGPPRRTDLAPVEDNTKIGFGPNRRPIDTP